MKLIVSLALALVAQAGAVQTRKTPEPHQDDAQLVGHYQLKPNGAGGYSWHGDGFTASVASDGSVRFENVTNGDPNEHSILNPAGRTFTSPPVAHSWSGPHESR